MANEYLKRTPTSTGNRKVWTWSAWVKRNTLSDWMRLFNAGDGLIQLTVTDELRYRDETSVTDTDVVGTEKLRDTQSWYHILVYVNSTTSADNRVGLYVNGKRITEYSIEAYGTQPELGFINSITLHTLGCRNGPSEFFDGQMSDVFFVDGNSLLPDVFGFYKDGNGYISAGSTQSTDFRPGQWVPKPPRIIKTEINRRGGFGVNGFYLPMNSSNNFGADFHCTPNSILKLKENLPQPKVEIDGVGDYTGALRDDPFKDYLVLAIPGVSGGLQNGFGDYSAAIRGSGIAKSVTVATLNSTTPSISSSVSNYYGSSVYYPNDGTSTNGHLYVNNTDGFINGLNIPSASFTAEAWFYADSSAITNSPVLFSFGSTTDFRQIQVMLNTGGRVRHIWSSTGSGWNYDSTTANQYVHANQWTHFCFEKNQEVFTTYINGVETLVTTVNNTINYTPDRLVIGGHYRINLGSEPSSYYFSGYVQDVRLYTNIAKYKGGFDVPKPYTPIGIATWRAVPDTTANNFSTMNSLYLFGNTHTSWVSNITLSDGNLSASWSSGTGSNQHTRSNFAMLSGKWYFEGKLNSTSGGDFGIAFENHINDSVGYGSDQLGFSYRTDGQKQNSTSATAYASSYGTSDIIGVAFDADAGQITFYKNGVSQGVAFSGITIDQPAYFGCGKASSATTQTASFNFGQNPTFSGNTTSGTYTDSNGKGLFKYQPPSGFLSLCEDNLPTPAIKNPGEHFKTVLYTGDDNIGRSITGVGFSPDFVWIKGRSGAGDHGLWDSVRGGSLRLKSNSTDAEASNTGIISLSNDGFSLGNTGYNYGGGGGATYVAWCWKAGGAAVTNTDGTITSQVSANQDAGFSIVSWTAANPTGQNTLGHGLGKTPKFIIAKSRTSGIDHWVCYHNSLGKDKYILLSSTGESASSSNYWSTSEPNSTIFGVADALSSSNNEGNMIAYCWAEIEGFSKFGSYIGNGNTNGPFVYCGFKPAWVMIKSSNSLASGCISSGYNSWAIYDNSRDSVNPAGVNKILWANRSYAEGFRGQGSADSGIFPIDFVSNGFKIRSNSNCENNSNGGTYIFAAFAESPFQTANSK